MNPNTFPTKGNLILAKNSLALAVQGYGLMDKKRNILLKELTGLIGQARSIQSEIDSTFTSAYRALQKANIELGVRFVEEIADSIPTEDPIRVKARSIMGTEIPLVEYTPREKERPPYSFYSTSDSLDEACLAFERVKELTARLATVETSAYRLAESIKKTQKRANALKNITIPSYQALVTEITNALEEKDREEFTRLKVIKRRTLEKQRACPLDPRRRYPYGPMAHDRISDHCCGGSGLLDPRLLQNGV